MIQSNVPVQIGSDRFSWNMMEHDGTMSHLECFCTSLSNRASDPRGLESERAHRLTGSHRHHPQRGHNQRVPTLTLTNYKSTKRTIHFLDKMTKHYSNAGKNNTIYIGIYIIYIDSIDPLWHPDASCHISG